MNLPNRDRAVIDAAKVGDYLLSETHPVGRFKASFFAALGYSSSGWVLLRDDRLALSRANPATPGKPSPFGRTFEVDGILTGSAGRSAAVRTVWIVRAQEDSPPIRHRIPEVIMFKLLDTVVLKRDVPEAGLRLGDLGAIVEAHGADHFDVEFVAASGRTQALVTLSSDDIRHVSDGDLIAVRPLREAAG
jgi:hypothetical protein